MTTFTVSYIDAAGRPRTSAPVTLQDSPIRTRPVVLLLHGNNGTVEDMVNPVLHPAMNYDYRAAIAALIDRGWHSYPNVGIWGSTLIHLRESRAGTSIARQPYLGIGSVGA
jgi:hypothetical protein